MLPKFKINNLDLRSGTARHGNKARKGQLVAHFDLVLIGLIELRGCGLVVTKNGGVAISPPLFDADPLSPGVSFIDHPTLNAVTLEACKTYVAMNGKYLPAWAMEKVARHAG